MSNQHMTDNEMMNQSHEAINKCEQDFESIRLRNVAQSISRVSKLPPDATEKLQLCFDNLWWGMNGLVRTLYAMEMNDLAKMTQDRLYEHNCNVMRLIRMALSMPMFADHTSIPKGDSTPPTEDGA